MRQSFRDFEFDGLDWRYGRRSLGEKLGASRGVWGAIGVLERVNPPQKRWGGGEGKY